MKRGQGKVQPPVYRECNHLAMMQHPERWFSLLLPVKHRSRQDSTGFKLLGFMFEQEGGARQAAPTVYLGTMFFLIDGGRLENLPTEKYASLEAVVAAGWEVD